MSFEIIRIDTLEDLKSYSKKVTASHRGDSTEGSTGSSELYRAFKSIWNKADFGDANEAVGLVFSAILKAITKEELVFSAKRSRDSDNGGVNKFDVVVVTGNGNDNNYPLNNPTLIYDEDEGYGLRIKTADDGNHIGSEWRYATDEEIDALFDSWKSHDPEDILDWFNS